MSNFVQLLIIEDDSVMVKMYQEQIEEFNTENEVKIKALVKNDLESGLETLKTENFDAAIVDLRLSSDPAIADGNQILKQIKNTKRFPVIVLSGYLQALDEELKKENCLFKTYTKTDKEFQEILNDILMIYNTGITKILGGKGNIEKYLNNIFWNHLANNFENWIFSESEDIEKRLLRYISQYLFEYLDVKEMGKFDSHEVYMIPPVKESWCTGDLIKCKSDERKYIILTPACDMVIRDNGQRNADEILISEFIKWNSINDFSNINANNGLSNDKRNKLGNYMENKKNRYHFLPPYHNIEAGFIDFQSVFSLNEELLNIEFTKIATISPFFLKDITARFSIYYSRQGQPDLDIKKIIENIENNLSEK